jgi:hypothetical protein
MAVDTEFEESEALLQFAQKDPEPTVSTSARDTFASFPSCDPNATGCHHLGFCRSTGSSHHHAKND